MPLTLEFHDARRRVMALIEPDHDGIPVTVRLMDAVEQRPEVGGWDWVVEVRGKLPLAAPFDLERLRSLLDRPDSPADTVVVTTDPVVEAWTRLLGAAFRVRRHWVTRSRKAAIALLDDRPRDRLAPFEA